ncbi:hypothetical protein [Aurantiacibacter zhengii]|uniref:Uncharacterized protein n=1 Tax=Aurantiacibacter zhengii TaxID=2307003 RepID=A0A418NRX5_9SPHN|nr:hypothetical protein [Aurantiacibacter zhengii]RIV85692.1 hypothetical protein D2V07_10155 [Aurantiacibacter zhengii]
MLNVSEGLMSGMEDRLGATFPARFHRWWNVHVSRDTPAEVTERLIFAHRDEFQMAGVREEEDRFLFLYARALMPEMGDADYLQTMDAIMTRAPLPQRMEQLRRIASEFGHRG